MGSDRNAAVEFQLEPKLENRDAAIPIIACRNCQAKLKVDDKLLGKTIRCPTCQQPQALPPPTPPIAPLATIATASPPNAIDDTLVDAPGRQRYAVTAEIGRGGMGTVLRAVDGKIKRDVAVKYLLNQADQRQKLRFVEEAQITGQLEHPNIVPIHDLGIDHQGQLYFSMKIVKGRGRGQVLDGLRQGDAEIVKEYTLGRLLNIFVNLCNALASPARRVAAQNPGRTELSDVAKPLPS